MAVEIELSAAHSPSPASSPGRSDPFFRIISRCETLEEIAEQGRAGLRGLLGVNDITEQTTQDLTVGLGFLRNVEIDIEWFEKGGADFRPGLETCNQTEVMEKVFGLTRDRPLVQKIRGGIVTKPPEPVSYAKILENVLAANNSRDENHVLLEHIRESLTISQWAINTILAGGNFSKEERFNEKRFYAVKFIRDKSRGYLDVATQARQEALRKYHPEQSHSDV